MSDDVREELERLETTINKLDDSLNKLKSDFTEIKFVILELLSNK